MTAYYIGGFHVVGPLFFFCSPFVIGLVCFEADRAEFQLLRIKQWKERKMSKIPNNFIVVGANRNLDAGKPLYDAACDSKQKI